MTEPARRSQCGQAFSRARVPPAGGQKPHRSGGSRYAASMWVILGAKDAGSPTAAAARSRSHSGDVGGEEVDAVAVEVAAGAIVVLCGAWVGVSGEDLRVTQGHAGVEGVGDGGVAQ